MWSNQCKQTGVTQWLRTDAPQLKRPVACLNIKMPSYHQLFMMCIADASFDVCEVFTSNWNWYSNI